MMKATICHSESSEESLLLYYYNKIALGIEVKILKNVFKKNFFKIVTKSPTRRGTPKKYKNEKNI